MKYKRNKCPFLFPFSFTYSRPHTCIHTQTHIILFFILNFITTGLSISIQLNARGGKRPLFLLFFSHLHRLMLKVCLCIVCNYACLHTEALLCVKVWKPFVAWGCEGKTAQTNFKQLQRHEDRWQTGASRLQTWVILYSKYASMFVRWICLGRLFQPQM